MNKNRISTVVGIALLFAGSVMAEDRRAEALASLVEAERAFAAMSPAKGMKAAFLAYLADDGLLFRPGPVNGKEIWMKRPDTTAAKLEWEPIFADVAASGDMGYTTGPWILTPGPNLDQPPAHGYFVSVWKKQKDGKWKLSIDLGIDNAHPEKVDRTFFSPEAISIKTKRVSMKAEQDRILQLEQRLARLGKSGTSAAMKEVADQNVRVYREGDVPAIGLQQSIAKLDSLREKLKMRVEKRVVASSCDLAYSFGKYDDVSRIATEAFSGYFVHIWKKNAEGNWKLMLDILNPPPPRK